MQELEEHAQELVSGGQRRASKAVSAGVGAARTGARATVEEVGVRQAEARDRR
jgi:hypothetical protein